MTNKRLTVVVSQGQSASPAKRRLEEDIVGALLMERGVEVTVIPHLYDLAPDGTGMLCLQGIAGDMVVLSWLYPRAAHWILSRNQVKGHVGQTLLVARKVACNSWAKVARACGASASQAKAVPQSFLTALTS